MAEYFLASSRNCSWWGAGFPEMGTHVDDECCVRLVSQSVDRSGDSSS